MAVEAEGGEGVCELETGVLATMGRDFMWGVEGVAEGVREGVGRVGRVLVRGVGVAGFLFLFVDFFLTPGWAFGTNWTLLHFSKNKSFWHGDEDEPEAHGLQKQVLFRTSRRPSTTLV